MFLLTFKEMCGDDFSLYAESGRLIVYVIRLLPDIFLSQDVSEIV